MPRELVILLHGIFRNHIDMLPLGLYLERQGWDTINILYPSRRKNIEDLSDFVHSKITRHKKYSPDKTMHFVTHSMGGLIARYYIARHRPAHLGKVVMLGTPNTGSETADFLNENAVLGPVYKTLFGPAGQQLLTRYRHTASEIDYPLGVIAGSKSVNPLAFLALEGAHDGIVPVERTKIGGMTDHIILPATHSFMMFNRGVMRQVKFFLENGKFQKDED